MLGREVQQAFRDSELVAGGAKDFDVARRDPLAKAVQELRPDLVINCAAYTDVARAEHEEERATRINGEGAGNVAAACARIGAALVHVSTDYVFDGRDERGYAEDAACHPINAYGRSKAAGEAAVRSLEKLFLVRTSWLYGRHGRNFVDTILRLAAERRELRVVQDQFGCPTYAKDLAAALRSLVQQSGFGTYHITNAGSCNWAEFAREIVRQAGLDCRVVPITTQEFGDPTPRPRTSILLNHKVSALRPWPRALAAYLAEQAADSGPV
jgi:dTDP-4-dehydrorhamnose reductase